MAKTRSAKAETGTALDLSGLSVQFIDGTPFVQLRSAAKLGGIHPVILEMGQRLLKRVDGEGAVFKLGDPEMKKRAIELETMFVKGLKKVAKALGSGGLKVKSYSDGERLIFWYQAAVPRAPRS